MFLRRLSISTPRSTQFCWGYIPTSTAQFCLNEITSTQSVLTFTNNSEWCNAWNEKYLYKYLSNTMLWEVTKILCLEFKVLLGWSCSSANSFYCLGLPIHCNTGVFDQNTMLGMESPMGLMLLQQKTLFIVSGSPMLGWGDQNSMLGMWSPVGLSLFIVSGSQSNTMC